MFLKSRIRELLDDFICPVSSIVYSTGDILYVIIYLLLLGWCRSGTRANEIHQRLNALYEEGSLVLEVVLVECLDMTEMNDAVNIP
jgi:hypothetical protein